jgi:hypothetical protein
MSITMIGLDTAKSAFQIHAVNETGRTEIKRKLPRNDLIPFFKKQELCTIALEACGASRLPSFSHHAESIGEHGKFREHDSEPLDQRQQPHLRHIGDQIVEHAALPEQRVSTPFGGV